MIEEIDIYRTAQIYVETYGGRALLEAMKRIDQYHSIGNESGIKVWNRIADAIQWIQMPPDLVDATCH